MCVIFKLKCKTCGSERHFNNKYVYRRAIDRRGCNKCSRSKIFLDVKDRVNINLTKSCPKCGNTQKYKDNHCYYKAIKNNTLCNSCKEFTDKHKKNMSISRKKRKMKREMYEKRRITIKKRYPNGIKKSQESIQKSLQGLLKWRKDYPDLFKKSIEKSKNTRLKNYGEFFSSSNYKGPNFNKNACKIFDEINKILKWNGVHAMNGGEKIIKINSNVYYIDYYEPSKNIAIEYDEKHHFKPSYDKNKDIIKESKIKNRLHCKFYRIRYNDDIEEFVEKLKKENL